MSRPPLRSAWIAIASLAIRPVAGQDRLPPRLEGSGSITSREFENKIYDPNDPNVQIATEWVTLTYTVTWKLEDTGEFAPDGAWVLCANRCAKPLDEAHEKCTGKCDIACKESHQVRLRGQYIPLRDAMRQAEREADAAAVASGGTTDSNDWSSASSNALAQCRELARKRFEAVVPHWVKDPCSTGSRLYANRRWEFNIVGTFTRHVRRRQMGQMTERTEPGKSHSNTVAVVLIPQETPARDLGTDIQCRCSPKPPEKPQPRQDPRAALPGPPVRPFPPFRKPGFSGATPRATNGLGLHLRTMEGRILDSIPPGMTIEATGENMSYLRVKALNKTDTYYVVVVPPGCIWVPKDGKTQVMITAVEQEIEVPSNIMLGINLFPNGVEKEARMRVLCMEEGKAEPDAMSVFGYGGFGTSAQALCAEVTHASRLRSGLDQARLWILNDAVSRDRMNARLFPPVGAGSYLNACHDVARIAGADFWAGAYRKCADLSLLLGSAADPGSMGWLIDLYARNDAKAMEAFIAGDAASKLGALSGPDELEWGAFLCDQLLSCGTPASRAAALKMLARLPEAIRKEMIERCLLERTLPEMLFSPEVAEASAAADAMRTLGIKSGVDALRLRAAAPMHGIEKPIQEALKALGG